MQIEVSNGEIADKVSILTIKLDRIKDDAKVKNVKAELDAIVPLFLSFSSFDDPAYAKLREINLELWTIEDMIRHKERDKQFDHEFVELARMVYIKNDLRAAVKKEINIATNSCLVEEKSYSHYEQ